jgi:hypothetical protein
MKSDNQDLSGSGSGSGSRPQNNKKPDTSTIADHSTAISSDQACVVYKFQSRPPYEGFILILVIVVVIILLLWWLNGKLTASET